MLSLRACVLLVFFASALVQGKSESRWPSDQIHVGMGTVLQTEGLLTVRAGADGRVFVSVAPKGLLLDDFSKVEVEFGDVPADAQFFVAWRTAAGNDGMHSFRLPAGEIGTFSVSLSGQAKWSGQADAVGLGVQTTPNGTVSIKSISLVQPTFSGEVSERLRDWSSMRTWIPADINLYTGTMVFGQGMPPVQFFVRVFFATLVCYLIFLIATARLQNFSWNIVGAIMLFCWICLDLLWQVRLGQQVKQTYSTFAGKTSTEKLIASSDARIFQFIAHARDAIIVDAPRIFLASANDYAAMLSAYYIAPLNTYWHRGGPELPESKFISTGDYILLVAPYRTQYRPEAGVISMPDAIKIRVEPVYQEPFGVLLRVI